MIAPGRRESARPRVTRSGANRGAPSASAARRRERAPPPAAAAAPRSSGARIPRRTRRPSAASRRARTACWRPSRCSAHPCRAVRRCGRSSSDSECSHANHGSLMTSCSRFAVVPTRAAIQLVGDARVFEQDLVEVEQLRPQLAQPFPSALRSSAAAAAVGAGGCRLGRRLPLLRRAALRRSSGAVPIISEPSACARPLVPGPVAIELDAVAVRIAKVERLADAVVARAVERDATPRAARRSASPRRRRDPDTDREVIEPGRARRRRGSAAALPGIQADVMVVAAGTEKRRLRAPALHHLEAEHAGVEGDRAFKVRHFQVDVADADASIDPLAHGNHDRIGSPA